MINKNIINSFVKISIIGLFPVLISSCTDYLNDINDNKSIIDYGKGQNNHNNNGNIENNQPENNQDNNQDNNNQDNNNHGNNNHGNNEDGNGQSGNGNENSGGNSDSNGNSIGDNHENFGDGNEGNSNTDNENNSNGETRGENVDPNIPSIPNIDSPFPDNNPNVVLNGDYYPVGVVEQIKDGINDIPLTVGDEKLYSIIYSLPKNKHNYYHYSRVVSSFNQNNSYNNIASYSKNYRKGNALYPDHFSIEKDENKVHAWQRNVLRKATIEAQSKLSDKEKSILKKARTNVVKKTINLDDKIERIYTYFSRPYGKETYINAVKKHESKYAHFLVDESYLKMNIEGLQSKLEHLGSILDDKIGIIHKVYGKDVDTDGIEKFMIIMTPLTVLGYFHDNDKLMNRDYLFVDLNEALYGSELNLNAAIIHEYQHMVLFDNRRINNKRNLDNWINEGLSVVAEYYAGYGSRIKNDTDNILGQQQGDLSLTDYNYTPLAYGYENLFLRYLTERFGESIIKGLYNSKYTGIEAIEEVTKVEFNKLFVDFVTMILVTGRGKTDKLEYNIEKFNYYQLDKSAERNQNGFCVADSIDRGMMFDNLYYNRYNISNRNNSISVSLSPYSFTIIRWNDIAPKDINVKLGDSYSAKTYGLYTYTKSKTPSFDY